MPFLRVPSDIDVTKLIENINSYEQCKSLNVLSVYFYFNTLSYQNYFFPEGLGGVQNSSGNSGGVGGLF